MKKIAMAISLVLIPLTAQAQSGGDQVIQSAADELKPAFCANDLKQAIQIVEGCYAKVDEDSEKYNMNQCVIEDLTVSTIIFAKQAKYIDNFQTDPYANIDFVQKDNILTRMHKHPNFMSNISDKSQLQKLIAKSAIKVTHVLKQGNCYDLDKLK